MATAQQSIETSYNYIDGTMVECPKNKGKYITDAMLQFGDYDNSGSAQRSNVAYILENYASNRYMHLTGHHYFEAIYLKNTSINAELICALSDYPVIDDEYHTQWEYDNAKEQFLNTDLDELEVIYNALNEFYSDTNIDVSDIKSSEYFWELYLKLCNEFNGGCEYYFENNNVVFYSDYKKNIVDIKQYCLKYFSSNPMFSALTGNNLEMLLINHAFTLSLYTGVIPSVYCMSLNSYSDVNIHSGGADYMTSHVFPFQEFEIDSNTTYDDIMSILVDTYESISMDNCEQLDNVPM